MQKKRGISLIVLVITIIVMIVLAGAIILTLNNSGVIDKANEAVDSTNRTSELEMLQATALLAIGEDGKVDFTKMEEYVGRVDTYNDKTAAIYTTAANNVYVVDESGSVTDITDLARYALGADLKGRYLLNPTVSNDENAIVSLDTSTMTYTCLQDPLNLKSEIHKEIEVPPISEQTSILEQIGKNINDGIAIIYNDEYYYMDVELDADSNNYSVEGSLFKFYVENN